MPVISLQWLNNNSKLNNRLNKLNSKILQRGNVLLAGTRVTAANSAQNVVSLNPSSMNGNARRAVPSIKANSVRNAVNPNLLATNGLAIAVLSIKADSARNAANPVRNV